MASVADAIPHLVRTANDPRQTGLYDVTLSRVEQVNSSIRLLRLSLPRDGPPFRHLPGQWLDVHIPSIPIAGGFTITSPPSTALHFSSSSSSSSPSSSSYSSSPQDQPRPYIELAIQSSPSNPPAAYLWQPPVDILHKPLQVRVGGKFVYPPPELSFEECQRIDRAVFVAGGVGVNPIMSMVSAMHGLGVGKVGGTVRCVRVLYSMKKTVREEEVLFYERLSEIAESYEGSGEVDFRLVLFETGGGNGPAVDDGKRARKSVERQARRIGEADLLEALGPEEGRENTVVYVCGPPEMTDEFVEVFGKANGMEQRRVLCEKWW